jgi:hypothetical protein
MWIKNYATFRESLIIDLVDTGFDLNESLNIWFDSLLNSIDAKPLDIFSTLQLAKNTNIDLEVLDKDTEFISKLSNLDLKKSNMQLSSDYETFLDTPARFMFIYDKKQNELETPYYLLLQTFNNAIKKWETTKIYKIGDNIKKFYDQLSSKTIEIEDEGKKYIYETGDGNNWSLLSVEESPIYKRTFNKEDLEKVIQDRKVKLKII